MKIPFTGQKSLVIHRLLRIEQPCANRAIFELIQIAVSFVLEITGRLFTVTFTESIFEQPVALVTIT